MPFLISLTAIAAITILIITWKRKRQKQYEQFVLQYSIHLKKLQEINNRYHFSPRVCLDQSHVYDNERYYDSISCSDYLIYQLQFISDRVIEQINKGKQNERLYAEYRSEADALTEVGTFSESTGTLKREKLEAIEKSLIQRYTYSRPPTEFGIGVTLCCSTMSGRVYDRKGEFYRTDDILNFMRRLNNRRGSFYRDREIWDAICRVERGKVSNRMRFSIYARDGYMCCRCGASSHRTQLEIDHIIPISKGGKSTPDNLQTLCRRCNVEKGNK